MSTLTSSVQGVSKNPEGTVYTVHVMGPIVAPDGARELRARYRALLASGILGPAFNTIRSITAGQLDRLTTHRSMRDLTTDSRATRKTEHTVVVRE